MIYETYYMKLVDRPKVEAILSRYEAPDKHVEWVNGTFLKIDRGTAFFLALAKPPQHELWMTRMMTLDAH